VFIARSVINKTTIFAYIKVPRKFVLNKTHSKFIAKDKTI
jgi:hypothetical protein